VTIMHDMIFTNWFIDCWAEIARTACSRLYHNKWTCFDD